MANYDNPTGIPPMLPVADIPGIVLPKKFALEPADRGLVPGSFVPMEKRVVSPPTDGHVRFPTRSTKDYGEAIARLVDAYSGPGFNLIFRPRSDKTPDPELTVHFDPEKDDLLELNLTHELWTFPEVVNDLGNIPNRVARPNNFKQPNQGPARTDVLLRGIPYTQIVRDVTDASITPGTRVPVDRLGKNNDKDTRKQQLIHDIHFEPGLLIQVERSSPVSEAATICRMASIPHGTTINAQGAAAVKREAKIVDGKPDGKLFPDIPDFSINASRPFGIDGSGIKPFDQDQFNFSDDMATKATRLPQDLRPFLNNTSPNSMSTKMIQDPNELLRTHNANKMFSQYIKFTVSTTPSDVLSKQACPHLAARAAMDATNKALQNIDTQISATATPATKKELLAAKNAIAAAMKFCNEPAVSASQATVTAATIPAIGSSNIAMLDGDLSPGANPNARTGKVESTFWISTIVYTINVEEKFVPGPGTDGKTPKVLQVEPQDKGKFADGTWPIFVFPTDKPVEKGVYAVEATQVQYSQTVNLIFNNLAWPHISVATLVPVKPVLVNFAKKLS